MNIRLLALAVVGVMALTGRIQAQLVQGESVANQNTFLDWDDPRWWDYISIHKEPAPPFQGSGIKLGQSDYTASGPFVETFRMHRERSWSDLNLLEKIESIPIVNLFVPQPMPIAPRQGVKYFKWGESDQPWVNVVDRPIYSGPASTLLAIGH